jgi:hypothetical protein
LRFTRWVPDYLTSSRRGQATLVVLVAFFLEGPAGHDRLAG